MKLAYRLLLIAGHTLGDFALPLMRRQCERVGGSMESLTPDQAEALLPALEGVLGAFVAKPADLRRTMHELRLEIGAQRHAEGVAPRMREAAGGARPSAARAPRARRP